MESPSNTQRLLLRYLLEQLSPEERERIDEALITDQEFSDSFAEARNEWLDAYVAGSLPPEWKKPVEQALIDTPEGASSVRVAAALHRQRALIPSKVQPKFPSRAVLAFFVPALAACMLLVFWLRSAPSSRPTRQGLPAAGSPPVAAVKHLPPPTPAPRPFSDGRLTENGSSDVQSQPGRALGRRRRHPEGELVLCDETTGDAGAPAQRGSV